MNIGQKILLNSLFHIAGKAIAAVLGVVAIGLMTRYLGSTGFGQYTTVTSFVLFFAILGNFGLNAITPQMLAEKKYPKEKIVGTLLMLRFLISFGVLATAPIIGIFFPYDAVVKVGIVIAVASFLFVSMYEILVGFFQQQLKMHYVAMADIVDRIVLLTTVYLTITYDLGLLFIIGSVLLANAATMLFLFAMTRRQITIDWSINTAMWRSVIKKAWPLAVTIGLNLIYLRSDTLILSLFQPQSDVGIYGAAYKVLDILTMLPMMIGGLMMPLFTETWTQKNMALFKSSFQKSFNVMTMIGVPIFIGGYMLAAPLMAALAGPEFTASGAPLRYLLFAELMIFMNAMFGFAIIAMDRQKDAIRGYALAAAIGIVGYFAVIPTLNYMGAAVITIITEAIVAVYTVYIFYKITKYLPNIRAFVPITGASLMMIFALYTTMRYAHLDMGSPLNVIFMVILGVVVYIPGLYLLGGITKDEIGMLFKKKPTYYSEKSEL